VRENPSTSGCEEWMRSYKPEELFDREGARFELEALAPRETAE
jgi:phosphoketolase